MTTKIYSVLILLTLAAPSLVVAEEEQTGVHGIIELGARVVDINTNSANFQEFRDLDDDLFGQLGLDVWREAYHFQFDAENPGADDQSFQLKGGKSGVFKYQFAYDELAHNYLFDAISPATGIGSTQITFPDPPVPSTATWNTFDYTVEHKRYGGEVEVSLNSPFYVTVGADKQEQTGLRPYSVKLPAEVPEPVANSTDTLHLRGGYLGEALTAALNGELSSFSNDHKYMLWGYPNALGQEDLTVFSPDNDYGKLGADLSWRGLPLASVLAVGGSLAHLENSYNANDIGFNTANDTIIPAVYVPSFNRLDFAGDIDYTAASVALSSRPLDKLDTKLYYRYLERDDQSSVISYAQTDPVPVSNAGGLLSYQKDDAGFDLGYRLPAKTWLDAGYGYLAMDRSVPQGQVQPTGTTQDDTVYVKLKNNTLDWLVGKVGFKHIERDSSALHNVLDSNGLPAPTPSYYQDQSRDEWQLGVDLSPRDNVDLGLDFTYKHTDYAEAVDTLQGDWRKNVYLDATWRACKALTLTGFVGFEKVETEANRVLGSVNAVSPDYTTEGDDDFWTYGLTGALAVNDKLSFNLSWLYQDSDGNESFSNVQQTPVPPAPALFATPTAPSYAPLTQWDDYTKQQLEAKAIYAVNAKLKMTVGYLYEKFDYADASTANYQYALVGPTAYYSGLATNPNYDANVGYLLASYGF